MKRLSQRALSSLATAIRRAIINNSTAGAEDDLADAVRSAFAVLYRPTWDNALTRRYCLSIARHAADGDARDLIPRVEA
jgi:hypothetical protein